MAVGFGVLVGLGVEVGLGVAAGFGQALQQTAAAHGSAASAGSGAGVLAAGRAVEPVCAEEIGKAGIARGGEHHVRVVDALDAAVVLGGDAVGGSCRDGAVPAAAHEREEQNGDNGDNCDPAELFGDEGEDCQKPEQTDPSAAGAALRFKAAAAAAAVGHPRPALLAAAADRTAGADLAALADTGGAGTDLLLSAVRFVVHGFALFLYYLIVSKL